MTDQTTCSYGSGDDGSSVRVDNSNVNNHQFGLVNVNDVLSHDSVNILSNNDTNVGLLSNQIA